MDWMGSMRGPCIELKKAETDVVVVVVVRKIPSSKGWQNQNF
jgi:hypothetical protein